ncbi:membrane protein ORF83 [Cyprinid herpesvirus 3]|nr:membrane protein ORF83 [Cyprinid herpesvirus 3]
MSPLCGLFKFVLRFAFDVLIAGVGVYLATSCLYDKGMFRRCPNSVCYGHLSVWLTVCVIPTIMGAIGWTKQFMYWVTLRTSARRRAGVPPRKGCCGSYREVLLDDVDDELIEAEQLEQQQQGIASVVNGRRHKKQQRIPAPQTPIVQGQPSTSGTRTTLVLFGLVCFVSYIAWTAVSPPCEWYIYIIPALVFWKILYWLVGTCVSSYRYSQRYKDVESIVNDTLSQRGYERV